MKNRLQPADVEHTVDDDHCDEIAEAVAVLRAPLPSDDQEFEREIDNRAERVAAILAKLPALL
jgi:flagellar motility protein MotE (MotC chaperone)